MNCPTEKALLLCAVEDAKQVLRCPVPDLTYPGLMIQVQALMPINPQLMAAGSAFFGCDVSLHLQIEQEFADTLTTDPNTTLYVARLLPAAGVVAPASWPSIPVILRSLSGRARIPYLRAWQVLAGGLQLQTKAVDAAEVAKYFDK